jgi:IS5 family transposase
MRERESAQLTFADSVVAHLGGRRTRATLDQLDQSIDWEALATPVRRLYHNDHGGNPAGPVVMMLKILLLQKWFNLSDPQAEEQINDRLSFRRFVGLRAQDSAPDETTIVKFRDRLRRGGVEAELFEIVARSIEERGLLVREGTLVDALILEAPTGRKTGRGRAAEPKGRAAEPKAGAASGDGAARDEAVDSSRSTQPEPREGKPSQRDAEPKTRDRDRLRLLDRVGARFAIHRPSDGA